MKKFLLSLAVIAAGALSLGAQEPATLTVADGTLTSSSVPLNMMYWDSEGTTTQVIYNESMVEDMIGGTISSIKFYTSGTFTAVPDAQCQISMGTTTQNAYETASAITGLTVVKSVYESAESGATEVEIVFDTPFVYNGGNLVFECLVTTAAGWKSNSFVGANQEAKISMSRTSTYNFMPKTTFTYAPAPLADYAAWVSTDKLEFGKTTLDTEKVMNVTLKNKGANAFTPAISGLEAPFSTTYVAAELASKETVEIPVKFAPTEFGEYTGTMTIDCGEAGTFTVALSGNCPNEFELTVCEGENQCQIAPIHGYYGDTQGAMVQMLYPANMLTDLVGKKITALRFYAAQAINMSSMPTYELSLAPTEETAFNCETAISVPDNLVTDLTKVATLQLVNGSTEIEFVFDTPYIYEGGNLAIQTYNAIKAGWQRTYFYGVAQEAITAYSQWGASGSNEHAEFLPKMTVVYTSVEEQPVEPEMNEFYVVGSFNDWNQTEEGGRIELVANEEETEFTGNVELQAGAEFKVITFDEDGEPIWFGGLDENQVGFFLINKDMLNIDIDLINGANFRVEEGGVYTITVKGAETTGEKGLTAPIVMNVSKVATAISTIATDSKVDNNWYNIQGQKLNGKPSVPGIYINAGKKVVIK